MLSWGIALGKINEIALAMTLGILYGVMLSAISMISALTGWAKGVFKVYSSFFPGFTPTLMGSIIGLIWGAVFGSIFGYLTGIIYNYLADRFGAE